MQTLTTAKQSVAGSRPLPGARPGAPHGGLGAAWGALLETPTARPVLDEPAAGLRGCGPYRVDDFLAAAAGGPCELLRGHLVALPRPGILHELVRTEVLRRLAAWAGRGKATLAPRGEPMVLAEHSVVVPDLAVHAATPSARPGGELPRLVVEVLTRATARRDREVKLELYATAGVRELWLVDPASRTADFLVLEHPRFAVVTSGDGVHRSRALPGLLFDTVDLWWDVDQLVPLG